MKNREAAIAAIRTCKNRKDLDDMLRQFGVTEINEAIVFLNECMYNPQTFASPKKISLEDELEFNKQIFLTGTWRLNDYYERMGIGIPNANG